MPENLSTCPDGETQTPKVMRHSATAADQGETPDVGDTALPAEVIALIEALSAKRANDPLWNQTPEQLLRSKVFVKTIGDLFVALEKGLTPSIDNASTLVIKPDSPFPHRPQGESWRNLERILSEIKELGGTSVDALHRLVATVANRLGIDRRNVFDMSPAEFLLALKGNFPPPPPAKPKRKKAKSGSGGHNSKKTAILAALDTHHGRDGVKCKSKPIASKTLASGLGVSKGTVSEFFKTHFGGRKTYLELCETGKLGLKLAMLNGEVPAFQEWVGIERPDLLADG